MMNDPLYFAAHNTLIALILALIVTAVTRVWRHPPLAHVLWLLVLVKLVVPPILPLDAAPLLPDFLSDASVTPAPRSEHEPATRDGQVGVVSSSPSGLKSGPDSAGLVAQHTADRAIPETSTPIRRNTAPVLEVLSAIPWDPIRTALLWTWLGGAATCSALVLRRIVQFERLLTDSLPPPVHLERIVRETAREFGLKRVPRVVYAASINVPLVWWAGGEATVVLPVQLFRQLDDNRARLIVTHELAHLARHDHWVRALETLVTTLYWWNPLAWLIRRRIHDVEDLCCDAWVRRAFPASEHAYAEVVLKTAEMLEDLQVPVKLSAASPFFHSLSTKARIEMILNDRFPPGISRRAMAVISLFAVIVAPSFVPVQNAEGESGPLAVIRADEPAEKQKDAAETVSATPRSEFPHVVKFEQGNTDFLKGDRIDILEVRGTAERFERGNIYWIKGTYALASHDRAMLAAYTTVSSRENATAVSLKVQTTVIDRGKGTFTLFLPMPYDGWPHVSFYPAEGGNGFGENYFGTGESVKRSKPRPQAARGWLPRSLSYSWTDADGARHVERWISDDEAGKLKLIEQTKSGNDLQVESANLSGRENLPSPEEVLSVLSDTALSGAPFLSNVTRDDVHIVVESIRDQLDDSRFYPLIGVARKHSLHYKCTVKYDKVVRSDWPVPYSRTEPNVIDIVYVDHDHLIRTSGSE